MISSVYALEYSERCFRFIICQYPNYCGELPEEQVEFHLHSVLSKDDETTHAPAPPIVALSDI